MALPASCMGMTVAEARRWAAALLADASETARLDAEVLLAHLLGLGRAALYAVAADRCLSDAQARQYTQLVQRRLAREPVAYLIGRRVFYDIELAVDRRVLIPRPETELLIELALQWAAGIPQKPLRVVDVGTGSGALAIVLARHLAHARVIAIDASSAALAVAAENMAAYGLGERVALVRSDLLTPISSSVDLIVSNPPYVPRGRLPSLPDDVRLYEPTEALDGGVGGLDVIQRLLNQAADRLATPGLLVVEIDATQGTAARELASTLWPRGCVDVRRDYAGLDRVLRVALA